MSNRCIWGGNPGAVVQKPWGEELVFNGIFHGKLLKIDKGHRTSLKFNNMKNEMFLVYQGKVELTCSDERHFEDPIQHPSRVYNLSAGEFINVQAGCPYQFNALTNCLIFEIGDNNAASSKVVIGDDYGRQIDSETYVFIEPDQKKE